MIRGGFQMDNEKSKGRVKRLLSTVGAGVAGSILTLGVVLNTNLLPTTTYEAPISAEKDSTYNTQQLSTDNQGSLADMVEHASSAIVGISNIQQNGNRFAGQVEDVPAGSGSGVIYKTDKHYAYIVTNNHVIEGAEKIDISFKSGETASAELVGTDALSDLAVVKVDAKYADTVLEFGDSDTLRAGEQVVAIGNPLGLDFSGTVTQGVISAVDRTIDVKTSAGDWELDVIQTDAAINPGNSGGALLNTAGEVIGINSLKITERGVEGLGFAIPSNDVLPLIKEMTENGNVERPYIGVGLANLNEVPPMYLKDLPRSVEGGVIVASVDPESAAGKAGIQEADVITAINGTNINNATEFRKFLYSELKTGDKAEITIYRGAKEQTIALVLTSNQTIMK